MGSISVTKLGKGTLEEGEKKITISCRMACQGSGGKKTMGAGLEGGRPTGEKREEGVGRRRRGEVMDLRTP